MRSSASSTVPAPGRALILALMMTRRCNMTCAHCSVESGPQIKTEPSFEELQSRVRGAAAAGVHSILFTGGEPMLRESELLQLVRETRRLGMKAFLATNGFWGHTPSHAERTLRDLRDAGLKSLTISYDRYHAPFQGMEPTLHIARAGRSLNVPVNVTLTRARGDDELGEMVAPFQEDSRIGDHVRVRFFDVQPVGRARSLSPLRSENEGFCSSCRLPSMTDDGRVTACNGPSYFAPEGSPLIVGSLAKHSLAEILDRHATDPILDTIRTFGVGRLREELRQVSGFESFPFRDDYAGMCELCLQLTSDPRAVAALRDRLSVEQLAAEREAMKRVMAGMRQDGPLQMTSLNSTERARVFWPAVRNTPWPDGADRILGRADLDWKRALEYLSNCGLARPLAARLDDQQITRWAPRFFVERLRVRATRDAMREFILREALAHLDEALGELGTEGVLLKSAAIVARAPSSEAIRSGSDVDVWVEEDHAERFRARLLARGFEGQPHARRTGAQHLAQVFFRGVPIEVHTRLLPAFWGLPEQQMLERRSKLAELPHLATLEPEAALLHAVVHCTSHVFSHGLKTAWDVARYADAQGFDWARLAGWVDELPIPRAFWTLLRALDRDLPLHVPRQFLDRAPHDLKQVRLEAIARRRGFSATEVSEELNPISKNAVFLMLCDTPSSRARLLWSLVGREASDARKSGWQFVTQQSSWSAPKQFRSQLSEAWRQWQDYRVVVRSPQFRDRVERILSPHGEAGA